MTPSQIKLLMRATTKIGQVKGAFLPLVDLIDRELGDTYISDDTRTQLTTDLDDAVDLLEQLVGESDLTLLEKIKG